MENHQKRAVGKVLSWLLGKYACETAKSDVQSIGEYVSTEDNRVFLIDPEFQKKIKEEWDCNIKYAVFMALGAATYAVRTEDNQGIFALLIKNPDNNQETVLSDEDLVTKLLDYYLNELREPGFYDKITAADLYDLTNRNRELTENILAAACFKIENSSDEKKEGLPITMATDFLSSAYKDTNRAIFIENVMMKWRSYSEQAKEYSDPSFYHLSMKTISR